MKKSRSQLLVVAVLALLGSGLASGCSHESPAAKREEKAKTPRATPAEGDWIKIEVPDGQQVAQVKVEGDNTRIEFGSTSLAGQQKETGKRKYQNAAGALTAEVKADDDQAFKVRTPDAKLLWKIKLGPEKIKIANNEEMNNPFAIEIKEANRMKVYRNEQEIGDVRFRGANGKVKVETAAGSTAFTANASRISAGYGVLLMSDIPEAERYIIVAELIARGR